MRTIKLAAVFLCCLGFSALLAWVGGFDFDRRDFWVAYGLFVAVAGSAICTGMASLFINEQT